MNLDTNQDLNLTNLTDNYETVVYVSGLIF